jgi:hypothetical protein
VRQPGTGRKPRRRRSNCAAGAGVTVGGVNFALAELMASWRRAFMSMKVGRWATAGLAPFVTVLGEDEHEYGMMRGESVHAWSEGADCYCRNADGNI